MLLTCNTCHIHPLTHAFRSWWQRIPSKFPLLIRKRNHLHNKVMTSGLIWDLVCCPQTPGQTACIGYLYYMLKLLQIVTNYVQGTEHHTDSLCNPILLLYQMFIYSNNMYNPVLQVLFCLLRKGFNNWDLFLQLNSRN